MRHPGLLHGACILQKATIRASVRRRGPQVNISVSRFWTECYAIAPRLGPTFASYKFEQVRFTHSGSILMRDNKGFTLIELLIVVVIIGILAAIAIPKFSATREKAYFAAMKSDLKNLASQQEIYYADHYVYSTDTAALNFIYSDGVTVSLVVGNNTGWSAYSTHAALATTEGCAVYYGEAATPAGKPTGAVPVAPGEIGCSDS